MADEKGLEAEYDGEAVAGQVETPEEDDETPTGIVARRHALDDARRTLDDHLNSITIVGKKGWRVMQFNGVVATIAVTLLPSQIPLVPAHPIRHALFLLTVCCFTVSTWYGYRMQTPQRVVSGPGNDVYRYTAEYDYPEDEYLRDILVKYSEAISDVQRATETASKHLRRAVSLSALAVVLLLCGIITGIVV